SLGRMLAVGLTAAEAGATVEKYSSLVSIAAINSASSITLSGDSETLAAIARSLEERNSFSRFLEVNIPYHSPYMDPLEIELRESLSGLGTQISSVPLYSTVSGTTAEGRELDASYWWANIRKPVHFGSAIGQMIADGLETFLEIGPHPVLAHSIHEGLNARH